jgi:hypothetical protein
LLQHPVLFPFSLPFNLNLDKHNLDKHSLFNRVLFSLSPFSRALFRLNRQYNLSRNLDKFSRCLFSLDLLHRHPPRQYPCSNLVSPHPAFQRPCQRLLRRLVSSQCQPFLLLPPTRRCYLVLPRLSQRNLVAATVSVGLCDSKV